MNAKPVRRHAVSIATALIVLFGANVQESDGALAARLGRARLSGKLSSNKAIRKQQLIVDPESIVGGSISTFYDASLVSFIGYSSDVPFFIQGAMISVTEDGGLTQGLMPVSAYFAARGFAQATIGPDGQTAGVDANDAATLPAGTMRETGFIQCPFDLNPDFTLTDPARIKAPPGYAAVAEDGPTGGEDTHALLFDFIGPPEAIAEYEIFADDGTLTDRGDFLERPAGRDGTPGEIIPASEIDPATVRGALDPGAVPGVPLPPAAYIGAAGLIGARLASRRFAQRA